MKCFILRNDKLHKLNLSHLTDLKRNEINKELTQEKVSYFLLSTIHIPLFDPIGDAIDFQSSASLCIFSLLFDGSSCFRTWSAIF